MKHTKGPWIADIRTGIIKIFQKFEEKHNCLSGIEGIATITGNGEESAPNCYRYVTDEQVANARLIAAAPDMLEALELVMETYCLNVDSTKETEQMKKARTLVGYALKKASGDS